MDKYDKVIKLCLETVNQFNEIEQSPRDYGTSETLFSSEIDTVTIIGEQEGINLTELSKKLEVSKSGASKFVNHLLEKQLIRKSRKEGNRKEVIFSLTPKGKVAYDQRQQYNQKLYTRMHSSISNYVDEDLHRLEDFFTRIQESLNIDD